MPHKPKRKADLMRSLQVNLQVCDPQNKKKVGLQICAPKLVHVLKIFHYLKKFQMNNQEPGDGKGKMQP